LSPLRSSDPGGGPFRKPEPDLYTVLLVIALLALLVGVIYLYAEIATYDFKTKGAPTAFIYRPAVLAAAVGITPQSGPLLPDPCSLTPERL
jgi:hypothetical protein